ncbi:hypothetical protein TNCV_4778011 [Trichonephila clavipes]|nr:hypothetical protein TNCV_4778011 [Trichonephila clavipes]
MDPGSITAFERLRISARSGSQRFTSIKGDEHVEVYWKGYAADVLGLRDCASHDDPDSFNVVIIHAALDLTTSAVQAINLHFIEL